ncbi:MAG: hypothetical protein PHN26_07210 [Eubacteriaceae bacterium]|nr:hypothetical protein [Eubacteriaceae bacterium]
MRASLLLNMRVESKDGQHFFGLIKDLRIRDGVVETAVISRGSLFSKAIYFDIHHAVFEDIDSLHLDDDAVLQRVPVKTFNKRIEGTHSLYKLKVYDNENRKIGHLADATIGKKLQVLEYEISRSFFDDLDHGFALIPAEKLQYKAGALYYHDLFNRIPETGREGGIVKKMLGKDRHETFNE